jgi:allantoin racemase
MHQLLIINPNTSGSVSSLLQEYGQKAAGSEVSVQVVTARFGHPYISNEVSYAVAAHATLDAWTATRESDGSTPHAVLIGCFGDPGLLALRETCAVPVTGLAEAAFAEAAHYGRFAIVTGGVRWKPILERLAHALGHGTALAGIVTVAPTGAQLAQDRVAAVAMLTLACNQAVNDFNVQAVILGGAGLAGMAEMVQAEVSVPVIDSVLAGVRQSLLLAAVPPGLTSFDV